MVDSAARSTLAAAVLVATLATPAGAVGQAAALPVDDFAAEAAADSMDQALSLDPPRQSPALANGTGDDVDGATADVTDGATSESDAAETTDTPGTDTSRLDLTNADAPDASTIDSGTAGGASDSAIDATSGETATETLSSDGPDTDTTSEPTNTTSKLPNTTGEPTNTTGEPTNTTAASEVPADSTPNGTTPDRFADAAGNRLDAAHAKADELLADVAELQAEVTESASPLTDTVLATVDAHSVLNPSPTVDGQLDLDGSLVQTARLTDGPRLVDAYALPGASDSEDDGREAAESGNEAVDDEAVTSASSDIDRGTGGPAAPGEWPPATPHAALRSGVAVALLALGRRYLLTASHSAPIGHLPTPDRRRLAPRRADGGWCDRIRFVFSRFGYRRYDDSDPLEHQSRATIYDYLEASPGAYLSEISDENDIPLPTVRYHLKILEYESLVTRTKLRGKRRYFPAGTEPSTLVAALADDGAGAVLEALASHGPTSVSGLASIVDRHPSTVCYHLQQLADDDLVEREREGTAVVNRLPPSVEAALDD